MLYILYTLLDTPKPGTPPRPPQKSLCVDEPNLKKNVFLPPQGVPPLRGLFLGFQACLEKKIFFFVKKIFLEKKGSVLFSSETKTAESQKRANGQRSEGPIWLLSAFVFVRGVSSRALKVRV